MFEKLMRGSNQMYLVIEYRLFGILVYRKAIDTTLISQGFIGELKA